MERSGQFVTPFDFVGRLPLRQAIPLGLQHVLAMFVGNLTPILIITNLCAATSGAEDFAAIQVVLLQNAMLVAGLVTLVQLFAIGPVGGKVPIIMGTSSGFIGVFQSVVNVMGGGIVAYGAIMGASILGGLFETVLGAFLKPLRRFFPSVVTGTVVLSIGLSLISVGVGSFGGGTSAKDYGSVENLLIALAVMIIVLALKHGAKGLLLYSHRHRLRLHHLRHSAPVPVHHRCHRRWGGVHQGLGTQLGQGSSGQLGFHSCSDACQAGI